MVIIIRSWIDSLSLHILYHRKFLKWEDQIHSYHAHASIGSSMFLVLLIIHSLQWQLIIYKRAIGYFHFIISCTMELTHLKVIIIIPL